MKSGSMAKHKKLPPASAHYRRMWKNMLFGAFIMSICLSIGVIGYKITVPEFDWYDSLLNASMILSGMGPVIDAKIVLTPTAKVFASAYALFSGVAFISTIGLLIAPIAHRFFYKMHLEDSSPENE